MKLYKVLMNDQSCHGGEMQWKVGKWYTYKGELEMCAKGYHLTTDPSKWFKLFCSIYEAETKDKITDANTKEDKIVVKTCKLIRKLTDKEIVMFIPKDKKEIYDQIPQPIQTNLKNFITKEIPKTKFFKPDGHPKKAWKVFYGDTWAAARDAARDEARDAAWDAAWDAARGAAWGAARGAARDAARDEARDEARDAAWGAAWGAARDAAWDAALLSDYIITSDLKFKDKEKHLKYAKDLWEVYQKGYACLCDVNGVLYVYCKGKAPKVKP